MIKVSPIDGTAQPTRSLRDRQVKGEVSIYFMSRYDVLTYCHPLTIELVQKRIEDPPGLMATRLS